VMSMEVARARLCLAELRASYQDWYGGRGVGIRSQHREPAFALYRAAPFAGGIRNFRLITRNKPGPTTSDWPRAGVLLHAQLVPCGSVEGREGSDYRAAFTALGAEHQPVPVSVFRWGDVGRSGWEDGFQFGGFRPLARGCAQKLVPNLEIRAPRRPEHFAEQTWDT